MRLAAFIMTALVVAACSGQEGAELGKSLDAPAELSGREQVVLPLGRGGGGVATRSAGSTPTEPTAAVPTEAFDVVSVMWGTNRKLDAAPLLTPAAFVAENAGRLRVGSAHVTIPKIGRERGTIQVPRRYALLGYTLYSEQQDPRRHFTIGDLRELSSDAFAAESRVIANRSKRFEKHAFVFVHGYNTTFEAALFRTAQLAYDLEFDGIPFMFSWPSLGGFEGYLHDRDTSEGAQRYLLEFLDLVAKRSGAKRIHLVAHSMGSRLLTAALRSIASDPARLRASNIEQVILAAPDIDAQVFEEIAASIKGVGRGITLYASANDQALVTSRQVAMGRARAGEVTAKGPVLVSGVDTIDVSNAGFTSLWSVNHSTFAERSLIIKDLQLLLERGVRPPHERFAIYERVAAATGMPYWRFVKN